MRFPEFSGEWENKILKSVLKCHDNFRIPLSDKRRKNMKGQYAYYGANGIIDFIDKFIFNGNYILLAEDGGKFDEFRTKPIAHKASGKFWVNNHAHVLSTNNILDFVFYQLEHKDIRSFINIGSRSKLNKNDMFNIIISLCSLKEQSKIANFLSLIDKRIELQNKIIKDYKLLKKELNNKLFCQINNSTPKIRFKNFYEKWAKNKVKNIFESVTRGYALSKKDISTIKTNTFKYPVYSSQTLNNGLLGYYSNYLYENAITWTTDGANAGEVNFRKDKFYCTNVCGVLLSNNGYCNECMAAIINKVTKKFVSLVGNPKLMNNVMENIEIIFPSNIKEQLKISIFLSTIDKIIALYKNAINLYKKQKNFFLSKLFI